MMRARTGIIILALAVLTVVSQVAAKKTVSAGPLGSAEHWVSGDAAGLTAELAMAIQRLGPEDGWSLAKAGELMLKAGQTAEAEKLFAKAIDIDKKDDEPLGIIALACRDARMWDKADETYAKAVALDPDDLDHVVQWGVSYWLRGDKAKAGELFAKVLAAEPDTERRYYLIGKGIR